MCRPMAAVAAVSGYRLGFLIAAGMIAVAVILAATLLTTRTTERLGAGEQPVS